MDFREVPIISSLVVRFSDNGDFAEAMAKVAADVTLRDDDEVTGLQMMTSNKLQSIMLARWGAEVAIKVAATPGPWNMTKLQQAYASIHDAISFIGYVALWEQLHGDG